MDPVGRVISTYGTESQERCMASGALTIVNSSNILGMTAPYRGEA